MEEEAEWAAEEWGAEAAELAGAAGEWDAVAGRGRPVREANAFARNAGTQSLTNGACGVLSGPARNAGPS